VAARAAAPVVDASTALDTPFADSDNEDLTADLYIGKGLGEPGKLLSAVVPAVG
jgi:hypothetical protein